MKLHYLVFVLLLSLGLSQPMNEASGKLVSGYRILEVESNKKDLTFSVYRGDYIKFNSTPRKDGYIIEIPSINIHETITGIPEHDPYFKMKASGTYSFSIGEIHGEITVLDYVGAAYSELNPKEAMAFIEDRKPLILDVRTPREYQTGHIQSSTLIPLQVLQSRISELDDYKEEDIFIYCRSGNRSTVASKILIDAGYKRIYNLRPGIIGWMKSGLPIQ